MFARTARPTVDRFARLPIGSREAIWKTFDPTGNCSTWPRPRASRCSSWMTRRSIGSASSESSAAYSSEEALYVSPEVYIEKLDEDYVIFFTDNGRPTVADQPDLPEHAWSGRCIEGDQGLYQGTSAVDLLRNIEHRRQTIYRVVESIRNAAARAFSIGVSSASNL